MIQSYRPIKSDWLTQGFGESRACVATDIYGNMRYPVKVIGKNDSGYCPLVGYKDFYQTIGMKAHNGVDWFTFHGEPVYHCDTFAGWSRSEIDSAGGIGVDVVSNMPVLQCTEPGCGEKHYIKRRMWHLMKVVPADGAKIMPGQLVGFADNTGASSGDHLHTSLKWCDKDGNGIHQENGYQGAFPDPNFENVWVIDRLQLEAQVLTLTDRVNQLLGLIKQMLLK